MKKSDLLAGMYYPDYTTLAFATQVVDTTSMILQIGVKVLLHRPDGKYLFIERTDILQNETKHSWDIPGGRIEPDEPLEKALSREVNEEIGADISGTPQLVNAQDIFVTAKDLHVVRLTYVLNFNPTDITLSDEHQGYTWLTLDEAKRIAVEPFLKETLEKIAA